MSPLIFGLLAVCAALISVAFTPVFARLAKRIGLVVAPRGDRWHTLPTPLLGGAAIALASLVPLAIALPVDATSIGILGCAGAAFALGLLDDFRSLAPSTKLVGQVMVAGLLVYAGIHVEIVSFAPVALLLTIFWIVALMNALNLMDNMDGLAAGIAAIASTVLGLTALPDNPTAAAMAAVTAGASLGFLAHNFYPARVFMGDAGSLLLGFLLAATALLHTGTGAANAGLAVLAPLAILALPLFDTALVTASRRVAGRPISRGGRDHTSHRLAALGLSDRNAVLFLYAVAAVLAGVALVSETVSLFGPPLFALACVGLVLFGIFLHDVDVYTGEGERARESEDGSAHRVAQLISTNLRFGAEVGLDLVLLTVAYFVSYSARFEGVAESAWLYLFAQSAPIVVALQLAALVALRVYRTLWRYLGISDAVNIIRSVVLGTAAAALVVLLASRFEGYSRVVFVLDAMIASALLVGSRAFSLWLRHWFSIRPRAGERRVLVAGATESGAVALRLLARATEVHHRAVGFIDDDPGKRYRRVHGVPIVGTTADLEQVIAAQRVDLVVVAFERDDRAGEQVRDTCRRLGVECREFLAPV